MNFDLSNHFIKIQNSIRNPTLKVGIRLGVCGFIPSHSFALSWGCECDSQVALLACTFSCPCLGREPKVKAVINKPKPNGLKEKPKACQHWWRYKDYVINR
jgi:hypothetical protein